MHSWKVNAVFLSVVTRLLILSSVRCEFEYYNAYPFYDESCIGGELENNTLSFDGATSYVNLVRQIPDLTQFTACWWMRSNAGTNTGTIVSYRSQPDSSIQIENPSNLKLTVNGNAGVESGLETNYGLWHHVCVTWDSSDEGKYEIYKAGERLFRKTGLATGGTITGNGALLLGKPNDGLTGGAYEGELTQFNMWSTKLDQDSVKALSEDSLNRGCGNVVSWTSISSSELVSVQVLDSELPPTPEFPRFCREHWENDTVWVFDGAQNHVIWNYTLPELSEFTVCLWIKVTEQKKFKKTVLSYFVPEDTLGSLVISNVKDVSMTLRNEKGKSSKIDLRDGKWHHLCVTWGSKNGQYRYYKNGVVVKKANLAKGLLVRGGGTLVVGQELVPTGGFVEDNALNGEITSLNMWSKALTEIEVQALYEGRCNRTCGDLIWWPYFTEEYPQTVDLKPLDLDANMDVCLPTDPCLPGVFDDKLWVIDNSGDWSLSPMPKAIPDLSEFTICFWFVLDDLYANLTNTVFSYYVPGDTEGSIVFSNVNNLTVTINNQISESTGVNLNDDASHMICLTWNSTDGNFTIYDKKVEIYQGTNLAVGETIKGGGTLVIGQKQSLIAGGFNKEDAFYGKFRNFNFYGNILDEKGIKKASRTCIPDCGDVISWHELEYIDLINIRVVPFTCGGGRKKSTGNRDTNNIGEKGRGKKRGRKDGEGGSDIERERPDKKGRDKKDRAKDRPEKKDRDKKGRDKDRPDKDRDRKDRDRDRDRDRPDKNRDRKDRDKKDRDRDKPDKDRDRKDRDEKDRDKDRPDKDRERKDRNKKDRDRDKPDKDRDKKDRDKKDRDRDRPAKDRDKKDRDKKDRDKKDRDKDRPDKDRDRKDKDKKDRDKDKPDKDRNEKDRDRDRPDKDKDRKDRDRDRPDKDKDRNDRERDRPYKDRDKKDWDKDRPDKDRDRKDRDKKDRDRDRPDKNRDRKDRNKKDRDRDRLDKDRDRKDRDKKERDKDRPDKDRDRKDRDRDRPDKDRDRKDRGKKHGDGDRPDRDRDKNDRDKDRPDKDRDRKERDRFRPDKDRDRKDRDKKDGDRNRPDKNRDRKDRNKKDRDRDRPDKDRDKKDWDKDRPDKERDRKDRDRDRPDKDRDRKDRGKKHGDGDRPDRDRDKKERDKDRPDKDRDRKDRDRFRPDKDRDRKDRDKKYGDGDRPDKDRDRKDRGKKHGDGDRKDRDRFRPDKDRDRKDRDMKDGVGDRPDRDRDRKDRDRRKEEDEDEDKDRHDKNEKDRKKKKDRRKPKKDRQQDDDEEEEYEGGPDKKDGDRKKKKHDRERPKKGTEQEDEEDRDKDRPDKRDRDKNKRKKGRKRPEKGTKEEEEEAEDEYRPDKKDKDRKKKKDRERPKKGTKEDDEEDEDKYRPGKRDKNKKKKKKERQKPEKGTKEDEEEDEDKERPDKKDKDGKKKKKDRDRPKKDKKEQDEEDEDKDRPDKRDKDKKERKKGRQKPEKGTNEEEEEDEDKDRLDKKDKNKKKIKKDRERPKKDRKEEDEEERDENRPDKKDRDKKKKKKGKERPEKGIKEKDEDERDKDRPDKKDKDKKKKKDRERPEKGTKQEDEEDKDKDRPDKRDKDKKKRKDRERPEKGTQVGAVGIGPESSQRLIVAPTPDVPKCLPEKPSSGNPCPLVYERSNCKGRVQPCQANIARGKRVQQSSGYWYTDPSRTVDGNIDSEYCHGSCTLTQFEYEPWVRVDLVKSRTVHYVTLAGADNYPNKKRLLGAEVRVGNFLDFRKNRLCGVVTKDISRFAFIDMACVGGPLVGRYVTVQMRCQETSLYLCELQVWTDDIDDQLDIEVDLGPGCKPHDSSPQGHPGVAPPAAEPEFPPKQPSFPSYPPGPAGMLNQYQQFVVNVKQNAD